MAGGSQASFQHHGQEQPQPPRPSPAGPAAPGLAGEGNRAVSTPGHELRAPWESPAAKAMQCQCSDTVTLWKNAAAGTEEEQHTKYPDGENERQQMKDDSTSRSIVTEVWATMLVVRSEGNRKTPVLEIQMKARRINGFDKRRVRINRWDRLPSLNTE